MSLSLLDRTETYGYDASLDYLTSAHYGDGLSGANPTWSYDAARQSRPEGRRRPSTRSTNLVEHLSLEPPRRKLPRRNLPEGLPARRLRTVNHPSENTGQAPPESRAIARENQGRQP